ncbi:2-keto-4-pentenoate hydratase [Roseomonas elaeocarpi]|uniref:2-keto-4-pentenoate hydratase n=1 Tax=Roseomonas elaeocarpi TaxID=907779 RepID=A0ABV6JPQ1_9PROT
MPENAERAAVLLFEARRGGNRLADLPEELRPSDLAQAYAIQDAVLRRLGPAGGWKVGPGRDGAPFNCARIGAAQIHRSPARLDMAEVPDAEIEVEVAVTLAHDLPPRPEGYGPEDLRRAVAALHPAIEIVSSRFVRRQAVSRLTAIADAQSCGAVVLGEGMADWQGFAPEAAGASLRLDGAEAATAEGQGSVEAMLSALSWLANHAAERTGGLRQGEVVITGARLGPWPCGAAKQAEAGIAGLGDVAFSFR